jgi:glycosyltransferase involved in cell wall biosynthesis
LPEVLQDSAEFVNPQDPADLTRAISKIVTHCEYKNQLIDKGFQNLERFSWEKSGNTILNEARKVM